MSPVIAASTDRRCTETDTEQVAAQTALLTHIQATRANTLVKAADPLPTGQASASPGTLENVVPQDRWVF